jgi:hypothetical protein
MATGDDQRGAARLATVTALIVVASFVAGKAARDAILLTNFDVTTLPIFVALAAGISLPIILASGRLMTRYGPARTMPALNAISAVLAVVEWLLLEHFPRPIAVAVFFHFATSGAVLTSGFWSIVNERFDVRSAKRHIGRIGIGATCGGIVGGLIAERTAVHLAPDKILLVLAVLQLACAVMLYLFGGPAERSPIVANPQGTWAAFRVVTRSRLLRNLGGIVVLGAIAGVALDYVFKADIVALSSQGDLLRWLAIFYTVTNVVTSIVQAVLCGPLIARLGVPRSVATLPITVTVFGIAAIAVPIPMAATIARAAELVTRNSIYRAGYELLYAPLPEDDKRMTKVVLDVGGDRLGDVLGAQLVGTIVFAMAEPRLWLLVATVATGALAMILATRLPRGYTEALEDSLLARAHEAPEGQAGQAEPDPEPWVTLDGLPSLGQSGEVAPLSLRFRNRRARKKPKPTTPPRPAHVPGKPPSSPRHHDDVLDAIVELRSGDPERIRRALAAGLTPELAAYAVELVGRDDIGREALDALIVVAPRCTGLLVDALLDRERDVAVRRRLPGVLLSGESALAAWGLWRALFDPSFEVRCRSGAVLARLVAEGQLGPIASDEVFEILRRELQNDSRMLDSRCILDELIAAAEPREEGDLAVPRANTGLEHLFTLLSLALPAEPLRVALHAVQTDDPELRGTALEYLESVLPPDLREQLWPLLDDEPGESLHETSPELPAYEIAAIAPVALPAPQAVRKQRSRDEILAALRQSYPSVVAKLRQRTKPL